MFNIYRFRKELTQNKWYRLALPFLRGAVMYLVYALMCFLLVTYHDHKYAQLIEQSVPFPRAIGLALLIFYLYLFLNTVILAFAIYNRAEREPFLEKNPMEFSPEDERAAILRSRNTWIELLTLVGCFLIFSPLAGWGDIFGYITPFVSIPKLLQRLFIGVLFFLLAFSITIKNKTEVRTYWLEATGRMMKKRFWQALSAKKARHYSGWSLALRLAGYTLLYAVLIFMMGYVIPFLVSFVKIAWLLLQEGWYWFIPVLLVLPALYYGTAYRHRRRFIRDLRALCRAEGYELFDLKHPYLSIFHDRKEYTFGVKNDKKTYLCRILAGVRRSNNMYLSEDGKCVRSFGVHAPTARMAQSGPFVQLHVRKDDGEDLEMFRMTSTADYTFEVEGEKILLLNPVPRKVYIKRAGQPKHEADNGDNINGYYIYTANAFLRKLEREDPLK